MTISTLASDRYRHTFNDKAVSQLARIVVSGATGIIGTELVTRLISETDVEIICLYRSDQASARSLVRHGISQGRHIKAIRCDLTEESDVTEVIERLSVNRKTGLTIGVHCAADVSWKKELDKILSVNLGGSTNFCRLIEQSSLQARLIYISTAYTSTEDWVYRNSYEESKAIAEKAIKKDFSKLQIKTFSTSIVVGNTKTGKISRFHGLYPLLKYLALFDVPFIVGREDSLLDVVPVDWVADELFAMIDKVAAGTCCQDVVASSGPCRVTTKDLLRIVYERINSFRISNGFDKKTVPAIIPYRRWLFLKRSLKAWKVDSVSTKMLNYFTSLMESYRYYIADDKYAVLPPANVTESAPNPTGYLGKTADYWLNEHKDLILHNWNSDRIQQQAISSLQKQDV